MSNLKNITNADLRRVIGNMCLTKVALAINAGSAATIKTTGTTTFIADGIHCTKAALSAQSAAVTHNYLGLPVSSELPAAYVQPISTTVYYVVAYNAAGTVAVVQGTYSGQAITTPAGAVVYGTGALPALPDGYTAVGIMKVTTNASVTFTAGTTVLDVAGLTVTYTDVMMLPATAP